ncbi:MAG: transposase family protein [Actinomyces urogenitalis]|uniref:transposase family protein n=1 Tax=Actinomyces urogenitalis TaxID=103621 RepID=UPI0039957B85
MPDHRCACPDALDRCDRCDFLLDFPGLHLVAVSKARAGLVLEVESCDPVAGCPGCGVIATGDGRVVVEVIDAPWVGRPVRIRWRKRGWICLEGVCAVTTFVEQSAGSRFESGRGHHTSPGAGVMRSHGVVPSVLATISRSSSCH